MNNNLNIAQWRQDTPGCEENIHFNNAGASLMPLPVVTAIRRHLDLEMEIGGYEARHQASAAIDDFYTSAAELIGAEPRNMAYAENGTMAYNRALSAIPFGEGDVIITTIHDYVSNQLAFLSLARRFGVKLIRARNLNGVVDVDHMASLVKEHRPKLVSVTHIPTNTGVIQPVTEIGKICRDHEVYYLVDAIQSVGQMPVDARSIQCDFMAVTARKFLRGPRGAGLLYVSDRILAEELEPLFVDLRGAVWTQENQYTLNKDATRFELWEVPYALLLGTRSAIDYANRIGLEQIRERSFGLAAELRAKASELEGITVLDEGENLSAIVALKFAELSIEVLTKRLKEHHINFSISSADNALLDFNARKTSWTLRLSPHYYNTSAELDRVISALSEIIKGR